MPFQPGISGNPAGRPRRLTKRADALLDEHGISPILEILKLMPELKPGEQLKGWIELLSYCYAKPKEIAVDPNGVELMTDQELIKLLKEKVPELKSA